MRMIDTQILVHMKAGRRPVPTEGAIASISAKEFLIMYGRQANRDRYYLSLQLSRHSMLASHLAMRAPAGHPTQRRRADKLVIDFNNEHPSIIEYSNIAITYYINESRHDVLSRAVGALPKQEQRFIQERFIYLLDRKFKCFALEEGSVSIGLDILNDFLSEHNPKDNFSNTVRDAMILGTAVKHGLPLQTEDKLLAQLAARGFGAELYHDGKDLLVDFGHSPKAQRWAASESKGYINRGWQIAVDRQQGGR